MSSSMPAARGLWSLEFKRLTSATSHRPATSRCVDIISQGDDVRYVALARQMMKQGRIPSPPDFKQYHELVSQIE